MKNDLYGHEKYPVLKLAQYLAGLTVHQEVWGEAGKALVAFFGADVVTFGERRSDEVVCHHSSFSDHIVSWEWSDPITTEAISEVLESGFFSTRLFATPSPLSIAFLPIVHENLVTAVMLVGYRMSEPFSKDLLEVYLAVAGLVGTTASRLASERELREHRLHLEGLVKKRTLELTETNEKLQIEMVNRKRGEEQYSSLFHSMHEGFCIIEVLFDSDDRPIDFRFLEINPAFEVLTGLRNAQGKLMRELAPGHEAHWFEFFGKVALMGESTRFVNESKALGRWYDMSAYRVGGEDSRKVAILFSDISALHASEQFNIAVLDTAGALVVVLDMEGCILRFNRACETLTGQAATDVIGRVFWEFLIPPEELAGVKQVWAKLQAGDFPNQHENHWLAKDGTRRLITWTNTAIFHSNQQIAYIIATGLDITERKRAENMLRESEERFRSELEQLVAERTSELAVSIDHLQSEIRERELAEKKLIEETAERLQATEALRVKERMLIQQSRQAAMGEMIGNISHQWRQPLNILGMRLQQLQLFYDMGQFNKELLEKNVAGSMVIIKHMSRTIDDFRNYFKPEAEKSEFKVQETINASLSLLEGSLKNPLIDVEVIVKDDPVIYGYPNEFVQVVLNIINNARDAFIEKNVSKPKVNIKICREDSCVVVTVTDNAGGIPEDIINNVFDPYFTTKGPQQGTGIGLFMSKAIIENNMCGRITVRNAADGAEFRIEVSNGSPT